MLSFCSVISNKNTLQQLIFGLLHCRVNKYLELFTFFGATEVTLL